jgi:two-component system NtrC family response regulator
LAESKQTLLIVEDDEGLQKQLKWCFEGFDVQFAADRTTAIKQLRRYEPAVVLQDLGLPPDAEGVSEGIATLQEIVELSPHTKVIVVTGNHDTDNAVRAVALGAYDFYQKPVDTDVLRLIVDRAFHIWALEEQNRRLLAATGRGLIEGIIGVSAGMQKACRMVEKVAPLDVSVLILGESGTGKELFARALHTLSPRNQNRFVAINCAAIPENLLESELFGYEKGAFTGAHKTTPGKIETAEGGTLFLDEIGDMPMALQSKLLRFLQERVVERVGGRAEIPVDVRVVCATHQDLQLLIAEGGFREDLYYRISEIVLDLPALRDREGDVTVLAHLLMEKCSADQGKAKRGFTAEAVHAMERYAWPGNVRELENKIKTAVIMAEGNMIGPGDLGLVANGETDDDGLMLNLKTVRGQAELAALQKALAITDRNISRSAELLGITRPTLYDLMERHGLGK